MIPLSILFAAAQAIASANMPAACASLPNQAESQDRLSHLFNYDKPAESEAALISLANLALSCGNRELAAASLAQMARAQGIQGKLIEAKSTLDKAGSLANTPATTARILLEKGRIARRERKADEARALLSEAFAKAQSTGEDALAADAAHMMALVEKGPTSAQWTARGLALAEGSANPAARRWVGNLAFNAGVQLSELGDHSAAALMFARSLAARRIENDAELVAAAELAFSAELAMLGRFEEAEAIQRRMLREATQQPEFAAEIRTQIKKTADLKRKARR